MLHFGIANCDLQYPTYQFSNYQVLIPPPFSVVAPSSFIAIILAHLGAKIWQ